MPRLSTKTINRAIAVYFIVITSLLVSVTGLPSSDDWRGKPRGWNNLGAALLKVGRIEEAKEALLIAIEKQPNFTHAYVNLGIAMEKEGRFVRAEIHYRTALKLDPGLVLAHYNLGNVLVKLDRDEEAIAEFNQAINLGGKRVEADSRNTIGCIRADQGRFAEAREEFVKALKADPDHGIAKRNLAALDQMKNS